jgi:hypothetical protein
LRQDRGAAIERQLAVGNIVLVLALERHLARRRGIAANQVTGTLGASSATAGRMPSVFPLMTALATTAMTTIVSIIVKPSRGIATS